MVKICIYVFALIESSFICFRMLRLRKSVSMNVQSMTS